MRAFFLYFILLSVAPAQADVRPELNRYSPDNRLTVEFVSGRDLEQQGTASTFTIRDRAGVVAYSDTLPAYVEGVRWTDDGKYLLAAVPANSGARTKQPWRYFFYLISVERRQWRWFPGSERTPFVSAEVWCQPPDTLILVGHSFLRGVEPPDAPVLLRYRASRLWHTLR